MLRSLGDACVVPLHSGVSGLAGLDAARPPGVDAQRGSGGGGPGPAAGLRRARHQTPLWLLRALLEASQAS